jgi:myo-inositol 2-dehydrogenase/D-chiro-inositol 1-dehydrogenase
MVGCAGGEEAYREAAFRLKGGGFAVTIDSDLDAAQSMAQAFGASIAVSSLDEALEAHGATFDGVVIRGAISERPAGIARAAAAHKHIHVEAPVALGIDEANAAIDACADAQINLSLGNTLRDLPSNSIIKDRISANKLGAPGMLRGHQWCSADNALGRGITEHIYGDIDLAAWIFEDVPTDIYALGRSGGTEALTDGAMPGYLQVHLGFSGGGMAMFDYSTMLPAGQTYRSLFLIGATGAAYADDHHNAHLLFRGGNPSALISREGNCNVTAELQDFVDAIREQRLPSVGSEDVRAAHQIADGVARSLETGQVLEAKGDFYEPR